MLRLHPLFDADENAAGDTGKTVTPPPGPTAEEVTRLKQELEQANAKAKAWADADAMLDESRTVEARAAAARRVMEQTGRYTKAEIEAHLNEAYGTPEPDDKGGEGDNGPSEDEKRRLAEMSLLREEVVKLKRTNIKAAISEAVERALKNNAEVTKLYEQMTVLSGKDKADATLKAIRGRVFDTEKEDGSVVHNLKRKSDANRGRFQEDWIKDEVERTISDEAQRILSVIGDANLIGRTSETVAGAREFLNSKPLEAPSWSPKKTKGDVDAELLAWTKDQLTRTALENAKSRAL
jgi:hypothetical protein